MALFTPSDASVRPSLTRGTSNFSQKIPTPVASAGITSSDADVDAVLELSDGSAYRGISFGAEGKSITGECVFQTGAFSVISGKFLVVFKDNFFSRNGWLHGIVDRSLV